jgi:hypothetical protein
VDVRYNNSYDKDTIYFPIKKYSEALLLTFSQQKNILCEKLQQKKKIYSKSIAKLAIIAYLCANLIIL